MEKGKSIIIIIILVLAMGITYLNVNIAFKNRKIDNIISDEIVETRFVYIKMNPLVKITYEEKYQLCNNTICDDVSSKIVDVDLMNDTAATLYKDIELSGMDIYDGIEKVLTTAKINKYDINNVNLFYDSEYFDIKMLKLNNNTQVVGEKVKYIDEEELKKETDYYIVTFDTDEKSGLITIKIKGDKAEAKIQAELEDGYSYAEWKINGKTYNFETKLNDNVNLKANLTKSNNKTTNVKTTTTTTTEKLETKAPEQSSNKKENTLTITFDSDGGTSVDAQTIKYMGVVKEPTPPTKEGYKFVEWQLNGVKFHFRSNVIHNLVLKAKWKKVN